MTMTNGAVATLLVCIGLWGCDMADIEKAVVKDRTIVIFDGGRSLKAGQSLRWGNMNGRIQVSVTSSDGVDIMAFPTDKDFRLYGAGERADHLPGCFARQSTRFSGECRFPEPDGVFAIYNRNWISEINVDVRIVASR